MFIAVFGLLWRTDSNGDRYWFAGGITFKVSYKLMYYCEKTDTMHLYTSDACQMREEFINQEMASPAMLAKMHSALKDAMVPMKAARSVILSEKPKQRRTQPTQPKKQLRLKSQADVIDCNTTPAALDVTSMLSVYTSKIDSLVSKVASLSEDNQSLRRDITDDEASAKRKRKEAEDEESKSEIQGERTSFICTIMHVVMALIVYCQVQTQRWCRSFGQCKRKLLN